MVTTGRKGISEAYKQTRHPEEGHAGGWEWGELPCPDVGVFRCFASLQSGYTPLQCAMLRAWVSARQYKQWQIATELHREWLRISEVVECNSSR